MVGGQGGQAGRSFFFFQLWLVVVSVMSVQPCVAE